MKMLLRCGIVLLLSASCVIARSAGIPVQNSIENEVETPRASETSSYSYLNDLRYVYKVYQDCSSQELGSCLKLKLLAALDRASRMYSLDIIDGVSFVKDEKNTIPNEAPKTEKEIEANLPRSLTERDDKLNGLIAEKVGNFLSSHSLQMKLPSASDIEEGRGKKNRRGGYMMLLPLILGGTLVPLALGALALLAGKALIVSKLALVLAGIIGLKKLLSGSGGHHQEHVEVVAGGHGGWGRSYTKEEKLEEAAQNLAYEAYAPKKER